VDSTQLLLVQALSLSGLVGGTGAYAGLVRHRQERRTSWAAAALSSQAAVERVVQHMALARLQNTFAKSSIRPRNRSRPKHP
jgi:16S rRNA C1402 (ribose-2'-O) methylase RsmI